MPCVLAHSSLHPFPFPATLYATQITLFTRLPRRPEQDVDEARQLMAEHQLDRILVVEGDRLVGIISEADIRSDEGPLA